MDYTKTETIAALVETVLDRTGGRLDALFNNGAYGQAGAVEDLSTECCGPSSRRISSAGTS